MFIPFPFPSAQLSIFFVMLITWSVPILLAQYVNSMVLGSFLCFFTVTSMAGVQEVGRELENPFRNTPNEVPLVPLLALYNEALVTMYFGYHPDFFWKPIPEEKILEKLDDDVAEGISREEEKDDDDDEREDANDDAASQEGTQEQKKAIADLEDTVARQKSELKELQQAALSHLEDTVLAQAAELQELRALLSRTQEAEPPITDLSRFKDDRKFIEERNAPESTAKNSGNAAKDQPQDFTGYKVKEVSIG